MRSSRVVRVAMAVNAKIATVLGSIPYLPTQWNLRAADEAVLKNVHTIRKKSSFKALITVVVREADLSSSPLLCVGILQ
jgi:hypothetical protein